MNRCGSLCWLVLTVAALGFEGRAEDMVGFADPGMQTGRARTPYDSRRAGLPGSPVTLLKPFSTSTGCLFDDDADDLVLDAPCPDGPGVYGTTSHAFGQHGGWRDGPPFWVVDINNEPAYDPCNPGPPHLSLPLTRPDEGLAGFRMVRDGAAYAAHLALTLSYPNPCGWRAIPFLSVGARDDRGNGMPVGVLNPKPRSMPHRIRFRLVLETFDPPRTPAGTDGAAFVLLFALSEWRGVPRMLYVNLLHFNREIPNNGALGRVWNWPVAEHYLFPGADIAYFDADRISDLCGIDVPAFLPVPGESREYDMDLHGLFRCASRLGLFRDRMPRPRNGRNLPIHGVHWALEAQGSDGQIWASVHQPEMVGL